MNQIKLTFGIGYFALNDNKYPKGLYIVSPQGNKLNITNVFTEKTISINLSQFVDSNNDPFATMDDLISQFNSAFNKGGDDGVGVVTLAEYNAIPDKGSLLYFIYAPEV